MNYQRKPINIKGWEMYEVDTNGIVYSQKGQPLKHSINPRGQCIVNLYHDGIRKGFAIHTLVAKTFLPNPENKLTVNHIDGNKTNNHVENLEWATQLEQAYHSKYTLGNDFTGSKSSNAKAVQGFDKKTLKLKYEFDSLADAGRYFVKENKNYRYCMYSISLNINQPKKKKSYRGCIWKFKDIN